MTSFHVQNFTAQAFGDGTATAAFNYFIGSVAASSGSPSGQCSGDGPAVTNVYDGNFDCTPENDDLGSAIYKESSNDTYHQFIAFYTTASGSNLIGVRQIPDSSFSSNGTYIGAKNFQILFGVFGLTI